MAIVAGTKQQIDAALNQRAFFVGESFHLNIGTRLQTIVFQILALAEPRQELDDLGPFVLGHGNSVTAVAADLFQTNCTIGGRLY